jgi:hypothetical protein
LVGSITAITHINGCEIRVIHRYDSVSSQEVIVLLPDQTRCALPSWMLDEVFCATLVEADHPILSVAALCNLGKLSCLMMRCGWWLT